MWETLWVLWKTKVCWVGKCEFFVNEYIGGNYLWGYDLWKTFWERGFGWVFAWDFGCEKCGGGQMVIKYPGWCVSRG